MDRHCREPRAKENLHLLWIEVTVALIHDESIACSGNSFKELLK